MDDLTNTKEEDFRNLGFGYRSKYLFNLINNFPSFLYEKNNDSELLNEKLKQIQGIGQKVADCIQLFYYGDLTVFPVDTWMKKFMLKYYGGNKKMSLSKIRAEGKRLFGEWAGYAQEFIYRYARCIDS